MHGSFVGICGIFAILQDFSVLIMAKGLLKESPIFFRTGGHLAKSLVKGLPVFF